MKRFSPVALSAVVLLASAGAASAQLPGIPYGPVETGAGIMIAADYAKPEGGGSAYGLTGGLGLSRFGVSVSAGAFKPSGVGALTSVGGRFGVKLLGGGLNPISIGAQLGANSISYTSPGGSTRVTTIMPGAFVKVSPPLFPLKPWGQVYYTVGNSNVTKEVRVAVGANFNLLLGLGVHGGYDWGDSGSTWGVGAHFNFRVPGLPGVPGM